MINKNIIALTLVFLFSFSFISAFTFDNSLNSVEVTKDSSLRIGDKVLNYTPIWQEYSPIKVDNAFGLGGTIVEGAITKHTSSCGKDCETQFTICNYEDTPAIEGVLFYRINKDGSKVVSNPINYQFWIKTGYEDVIVNDYGNVCSNLIAENGSKMQNCEAKVIGTHTEKKAIWEEYNYENKQGCYDYKLTGQKRQELTYDFVPIIGGKAISQWAVWSGYESTIDKVIWYKFSQGSGTNVIDFIKYKNGTYDSAPTWEASTFTGFGNASRHASIKILNTSIYSTATLTDNFTIEMRLTSGDTTSAAFLTWGAPGTNGWGLTYDGSNKMSWKAGTCGQVNGMGATWTVDKPTYFVITRNSTTWKFYQDGVLTSTQTCNSPTTLNGNLIFGTDIYGYFGGNYVGQIDNLIVWNRTLEAAEILAANSSTGDGLSVSQTLNYPINNYVSSTTSINFNCSASTDGFNTLANISFWDNSTGTFARRFTSNITGLTNSSLFTKTYTDGKNYIWNCEVCDSDSICSMTNANRTFSVDLGEFQFGQCNDTLIYPYINFTFKDENTLANVNAAINPLNVSLFTENISYLSSFYFINTTENPSYALCSNAAALTLYNPYGLYVRYYSTGYPARSSTITGVFNESTANRVLYLLNAADGLDVTFQVVNNALQSLPNAEVTITSGGVTVAQGSTDASGTYTVFLNSANLHSISVSKSGYDSYTAAIYPTQTSYSIILNSNSTSSTNITDYRRGIMYSFSPNTNNFLVNNTIYPFNMTINSTYNDLTAFGIYITNGTTTLTAGQTTGNSGVINVNLDTGSNSQLYVYGWWTISGVNTTTIPIIYSVWSSADTSWSISYLVNDLKTYLASGMFGLTLGFNMNLLIFFIIFIATGILSWKYGLYSPIQIAGMIFILTLFFDVGLGLITTSVDYIATTITGIVLVSIIIKEALGY